MNPDQAGLVPTVEVDVNDGQRMLRAAMARRGESQHDVAARLERSQPAIWRWLNGFARPDIYSRIAAQRVYEIPLTAWDHETAGASSRETMPET